MSIIRRKAGSEDIVKSVLEFDAVPTEGSPNLVDSGAVAQAIGNLGQPLQWKGPATVSELNDGIEGIQPGWTYTLTDAGTLTDGSVKVDVGDEVAWTEDDEWFQVGPSLVELKADVVQAKSDIADIQDVVPEEASDSNKLVTKDELDNVQESIQSGFTPKGEISVSDLNDLTTQSNGDQYILTDSGTITDGSVTVEAGDSVAWNSTDSVWYKVNQYALSKYGTDEIKNLPTSITSFRTGDVIPVDGPSGTAKMSKDDLLQEAKNFTQATNREVILNYIFANRATNPADLDDLKKNKIYLVQRDSTTTTENFPSDFGRDMAISTLEITTAKYGGGANDYVVTQKLTALEKGDVWTRRWSHLNEYWTDWVHQNNFNSYVKEKSSEQKGFSDYVGVSTSWTSSQNEVIMTVKDSAVQKKSLISKIKIKVNKEGKYRFFTAVVDQNNYIANASAPFDLTLSAGVNEVNVLSLGLTIGEGATLFVYSDYWNNSSSAPKGVSYTLFTNTAPYIDHEVIYTTSLDQPVHRFNVTGGGVICFSWDVVDVESAFAFREDVENVAEQTKVNSEAIEASKIIAGANGNLYTIGVDVNGNVVALALNFSNGLCIGNSLTDHAPSPEYGWYGDGFPMAASNGTTGWINELQEIFRQKNPSAVVGRIGGTTISAFERAPQDYVTDEDFDAIMGSYVGANLDFIIYKAGENVSESNLVNYKAGLKRFISYLKRKYTSAQLFISQPFYGQPTISNVTLEAATETYTQYIANGSSFRRQILGMFTYGDGSNIYPIVYAPVAQHLGDDGFLTWANHLAERLGYQPLDWFKTITLSAVGFDTLVNGSRGVKGGIYTILGKGMAPSSISILDGSLSPVAYTLHDMTNVSWLSTPSYVPDWAISFIVPSTDVTVTLT